MNWEDKNIAKFPYINTKNITNFEYFCAQNCNLTRFPLLNTKNGVYFSHAWYRCHSLKEFPLINSSHGKSFDYAWAECVDLIKFPELDLSSGVSFASSWADCSLLEDFPFIDMPNAIDFNTAWNGCTNLKYFPPNMFDKLEGRMRTGCFYDSWYNTNLTAESISNILISINKAKITPFLSSSEITLFTNKSTIITSEIKKAMNSLANKGWNPKIYRDR